MTLLVITNNPHNASFRQRIEQYLPAWEDEGIDCEIVRLPRALWARQRLFTRAGQFDAVLLHKKTMNPHDAFLLRRYSRRIVYDFDDAVMYNPKALARGSGRRLRAFRRTVRLADLVIAGNAYLAEHARAYNSNVQTVPTGLDTSAYRRQVRSKPDGRIRLVWIGGRATLPYLQQISPALEQVGACFPNSVLTIICDTFFDLLSLPVEKRPWSRKTEVSDLVSSDIALAPLPDDLFTRGKCGFKILQYAAAGLPVVASPVGVNAEYVQDGVTGFHATEASAWVDKIGRLIQDEALRTQMGQAAGIWVNDFDTRAVKRRLVIILKECLTGR